MRSRGQCGRGCSGASPLLVSISHTCLILPHLIAPPTPASHCIPARRVLLAFLSYHSIYFSFFIKFLDIFLFFSSHVHLPLLFLVCFFSFFLLSFSSFPYFQPPLPALLLSILFYFLLIPDLFYILLLLLYGLDITCLRFSLARTNFPCSALSYFFFLHAGAGA